MKYFKFAFTVFLCVVISFCVALTVCWLVLLGAWFIELEMPVFNFLEWSSQGRSVLLAVWLLCFMPTMPFVIEPLARKLR